MIKIQYKTNEEYWAIKSDMKAKGYVMVADCYWCQIYSKDGQEVIAERQ